MPFKEDLTRPHLGPYSPDEGIAIRRLPNGGVVVTSISRVQGVEPVPVGAFGSWAEMVDALRNSAPAAPRGFVESNVGKTLTDYRPDWTPAVIMGELPDSPPPPFGGRIPTDQE